MKSHQDYLNDVFKQIITKISEEPISHDVHIYTMALSSLTKAMSNIMPKPCTLENSSDKALLDLKEQVRQALSIDDGYGNSVIDGDAEDMNTEVIIESREALSRLGIWKDIVK